MSDPSPKEEILAQYALVTREVATWCGVTLLWAVASLIFISVFDSLFLQMLFASLLLSSICCMLYQLMRFQRRAAEVRCVNCSERLFAHFHASSFSSAGFHIRPTILPNSRVRYCPYCGWDLEQHKE